MSFRSYGQFCDQSQPGAGFPSAPTCQNVICANDPYCCSTLWDGLCASSAAIEPACASCLSTGGGGSGCNSGALYTTFTPACNGTQEAYASCTYAGEYNQLNLSGGTNYTFGSSVSTDYITITNSSNTILAAGNQPLSFTPSISGTYQVYIHLNSFCGTVSACRFPWVQCNAVAPGVANDDCSTATPVILTDGAAPTIINATNVGSTPSAAETNILGFGAVWYAVTMTGSCNHNLSIRYCGTAAGVQSDVFIVYTPCPLTTYTPTSNFSNLTCGDGNYVVNFQNLASGTYYIPVLSQAGYQPLGNYTISFSSTVTDAQAPVPAIASLPPVNSQCSLNSLTAPTANDNCSGVITGVNNVLFPITSSTLVTWIYTDANGNASSQTQNIFISDTQGPTPNSPVLANVVGQCSVTSLTPPTATDNCSGSITGVHNAALPITSSTLITWTFTDGNGNSSTQTLNIIVNDTQSPVANTSSLPAVTAQCSVTSLTPPTATDNCSGSITGVHNAALPITASTIITWTYTDGSGNSSTQTQNIIVNDTQSPVANTSSLPAVTAQCSVTSLTPPTATDNCSGSITGVHNATLPITSSTVVTWTFTDGSGNSSTQNQNIIVNDSQSPVADLSSLPAITEQCSVTTLTPPTATDNCSGSITGIHNATLPITSTTVVTWTYTDGNGNSSTQTQNIIVNDTQSPVANTSSLPAITEQCSVTSLTPPTATDNCSGSITGIHNATLPITSSTVLTWTYTDLNGNILTQNQNVLINDTEAPLPNQPSLNAVTGFCEITVLTPPTASDNCSGLISGTTITTLPVTNSTTITWNYTDGNGNTSAQDQQLIVNPITAGITLTGNTLTADFSEPGTTYQWIDCANGNAPILNETASSFSPAVSGNYGVVVSFGNCSETSLCQFIDVSGINDLLSENTIYFPNPVNNEFFIQMMAEGNFELFDQSGKRILQSDLNKGINQIYLNEISAGSYILRISSDSLILNDLLIISR